MATVYIFDDDSDDAYTLSVLQKASERHHVIKPQAEQGASSKLGGLYNNMTRAVQLMPEHSFACFLQDDMQCVRELQQQDILDIHQFFDANPKAAFLQPAFLKGSNRTRNSQTMTLCERSKVYFRHNPKQSAGIHCSDIIIFNVDRLRAADWVFETREKLNDKKAEQLFGKMGFLANPFCAWLPNVPIYRGKRKTLALKLAEKLRKSDFYPLKFMTDDENQTFIARDLNTLPVAEDYLELAQGELKKPWIYYSLEGLSLFKQLNRLELAIVKLVQRCTLSS